jgi:hypothetical protein
MIDDANCVVVLLTAEGLRSHEVLDEISRSHDRKKFIIPVVAKGTRLEALPWYIRDLKWIEYDNRKFDDVVDVIVRAIDQRASPLKYIDAMLLTSDTRALLASGSRYVEVPYPEHLKQKAECSTSLVCILEMAQSDEKFVFKVAENMRVEDAANFLVNELMPAFQYEEYEWTLLSNERELAPYHTFITAGVRSGQAVRLIGNHRRPRVCPSA